VSVRALVRRCWASESGATAIEYGLIVGIISTVVMSIASTGGAVEALYNTMAQIAGALGP
jgi:Flp pilus assembly pilin Flp